MTTLQIAFHPLQVLHESVVKTMRMEKDPVDSAGKGAIVGLHLQQHFEFQEDDKVICYKVNRVPQKLKWDLGF